MNLLQIEIYKTFEKIKKIMDTEALHEFINTDERNLGLYHFGLGTWIRNCILKEGSNIYKQFVCCGITHKDDMSGILLLCFHKYSKIAFKG